MCVYYRNAKANKIARPKKKRKSYGVIEPCCLTVKVPVGKLKGPLALRDLYYSCVTHMSLTRAACPTTP